MCKYINILFLVEAFEIDESSPSTNKLPGVCTSISCNSPVDGVRGRQFKTISNSTKSVENSSNVRFLGPITRFR